MEVYDSRWDRELWSYSHCRYRAFEGHSGVGPPITAIIQPEGRLPFGTKGLLKLWDSPPPALSGYPIRKRNCTSYWSGLTPSECPSEVPIFSSSFGNAHM